MIILFAAGQTCNKFFIYRNYILDSLVSGEKIIILSPDITTKDYDNLNNSDIVKFPFYSVRLSKLIGYKNYINFLDGIFNNRYSIVLIKTISKIVPSIKVVEASVGSYKSPNRGKNNSEILNLFMPNQRIKNEVDLVFDKMKQKYDVVCGIHMRYGDYRTFEGGKYFYSPKQYCKIMLDIKELFLGRTIAFFISSNEEIDLSLFPGCECFLIPKGSATKDLYGLSLTDYIMGPRSTFSGWASYYGNKPIYFIEDPNTEIKLSSFRSISEKWKLFS